MRKVRREKTLDALLEKKLSAYALAGAAGLGALAVPPVEAAVVYTAANLDFSTQNSASITVPVDLNRDGIVDFQLQARFNIGSNTFTRSQINTLVASMIGPNRVAYARGLITLYAQALSLGARIDREDKFTNRGALMAVVGHDTEGFSAPAYFTLGNFPNASNRFLGIKFVIHGETHYGWARVNVNRSGLYMTFELVDYAYQSIPNLPILAGQGIPKPELDSLNATSPAASAKQYPASLGMLAYGADALPLWRRKQQIEGQGDR